MLRIRLEIDELHLEYPFAGSRMLRDFLNRGGGLAVSQCRSDIA